MFAMYFNILLCVLALPIGSVSVPGHALGRDLVLPSSRKLLYPADYSGEKITVALVSVFVGQEWVEMNSGSSIKLQSLKVVTKPLKWCTMKCDKVAGCLYVSYKESGGKCGYHNGDANAVQQQSVPAGWKDYKRGQEAGRDSVDEARSFLDYAKNRVTGDFKTTWTAATHDKWRMSTSNILTRVVNTNPGSWTFNPYGSTISPWAGNFLDRPPSESQMCDIDWFNDLIDHTIDDDLLSSDVVILQFSQRWLTGGIVSVNNNCGDGAVSGKATVSCRAKAKRCTSAMFLNPTDSNWHQTAIHEIGHSMGARHASICEEPDNEYSDKSSVMSGSNWRYHSFLFDGANGASMNVYSLVRDWTPIFSRGLNENVDIPPLHASQRSVVRIKKVNGYDLYISFAGTSSDLTQYAHPQFTNIVQIQRFSGDLSSHESVERVFKFGQPTVPCWGSSLNSGATWKMSWSDLNVQITLLSKESSVATLKFEIN